MDFIGVSSSDQARRGWWRTTLKGDILDPGYFLSNPLEKWPDKVEKWRAAIDAGGAEVPALTSTASVTPEAGVYGARAVVDVHILGADQGDSVGAVARRMSDLRSNIDVERIEIVANSDPIARDAALLDSKTKAEQSDPFGLKKLLDRLGTAATLAIVAVAVYVIYRLVKEARE